jgi:hypothetical protein
MGTSEMGETYAGRPLNSTLASGPYSITPVRDWQNKGAITLLDIWIRFSCPFPADPSIIGLQSRSGSSRRELTSGSSYLPGASTVESGKDGWSSSGGQIEISTGFLTRRTPNIIVKKTADRWYESRNSVNLQPRWPACKRRGCGCGAWINRTVGGGRWRAAATHLADQDPALSAPATTGGKTRPQRAPQGSR